MASKSWKPRRRALIVDDDPDIRIFLCDLLAHWQYEPVQATSGLEALEILQRCTPEVVVLDLVMPTMDGLETLHAIRRQYRDLPVIMMSALLTTELDRMLRREGARICLDKPIERQALAAAFYLMSVPSGFADS